MGNSQCKSFNQSFVDSKSYGHGQKLRLFKVDRWDNGLYYCAANIHTKDQDVNSTENRKTTFKLDVSAPKVSTSASTLEELGIDEQSIEENLNDIFSTISRQSVSYSKYTHAPNMDAEDDNMEFQDHHAAFGTLGAKAELDCTVSKCKKSS